MSVAARVFFVCVFFMSRFWGRDIQTAGNGILTVPGYDCGGGL